MLKTIIEYSVNNRLLVVIGFIAISIFGYHSYQKMPVDAFPDISPVMVPVFAEAHGMAPEEVERLITFPIEAAMNGLPSVTQIKSTSAFGLAVIYVYFEDNIDIYFARQLVSERLSGAMNDLPEMHDPPSLGPISTGLGQIFLYYLTLDPGVDTDGKEPDTYLREINDWIVKYQIQTVPGVTEILSIGGHVLQYQVQVNPHALSQYKIGLEDVVDAIQSNNRNVGGQFLVIGAEEYLVRGIGLLNALDELRNIKLDTRNGVPITIGDIADVAYGNEIRRGVVTRNGEGEVVSGIVMKLYGENTSEVISDLYDKVAEVQDNLPDGVNLHPYYEQAELVQKATGTIKNALLLGALLVIITLAVFLGKFRTAFIVALALPFCALVSFIFMSWHGVSANLMSLGGIAIGIGMLGDGAIVMVENVYRHLSLQKNAGKDKSKIITDAALEVARPILFSISIIIMVFLPIYALENVEGKMFSPMAYTISFALIASIIVALVISPSLSCFLLDMKSHKELFMERKLKQIYKPLLSKALRHEMLFLGIILVILMGALAAFPFLGTEFIPTLEEGSILIGVTMAPSTSLEKGTETIIKMEKQIMKYGEVDEVISRIGRPEAGSHPHPVNYAEIHIELKPFSEWKSFGTKSKLIEALSSDLESFPGVNLNFTQPIQNAFDELLSGVKSQLAIKIYGENLDTLRTIASETKSAIEGIPGLVDLSVEQNFGQPQVQVEVDREACSRFGINVDQVLELVELAVGGENIDTIYLGTRRFAINLRYQEPFRYDTNVMKDLLVHTDDGKVVPLAQVASVEKTFGPTQINREKNQRRWIVQANIRGRDLGSVVDEIKSEVDKKVNLPLGYFIEYGGQFENQQRAMSRLVLIFPVVIFAVFILLYLSFGTIRHSLIIILNVPLALIGGIAGLLITGEYLSVPASIGFIALFGIAVQNGMVLISYINMLIEKGIPLSKAIEEGAVLRLRPVLMTTLTTILGLMPLLLSTGIGAEVQRPLAVVVVFGLATSTILTLFVLPVVYSMVESKRIKVVNNGN